MPSCSHAEADGRRRADADLVHLDAARAHRVRPASPCVCASAPAIARSCILGRGAVAVAGVAEQPAEPQARQAPRSARRTPRHPARVGIDAAAMEADVHLDEDVDLASGAVHRLRPAARDVHVIHDERQARPVEQLDDALGVDGIERIGQADVVDARRRRTPPPRRAWRSRCRPRRRRSARVASSMLLWVLACGRSRRPRRSPPTASVRDSAPRARSTSTHGVRSCGSFTPHRSERRIGTPVSKTARLTVSSAGNGLTLFQNRPSRWLPVKPGKTREVSASARCPRTTSLKTARKSVVIARSRPSCRCSRAEARPLAVDLAAADAAADDHHRVAVTVIGAAGAVLRHRPPELRHRHHDDVLHAVAEIADERRDAAREIVEPVGEDARPPRPRWRGGPSCRTRRTRPRARRPP